MDRIAILGAGDLGRSIRAYVEDRGDARLVGWLDDGQARGSEAHGLPVLGGSADALALQQDRTIDGVAFAIGYRDFEARARLFERLREQGVSLRGVVHPTAWIHPSARIGAGVHLFPGVVVDLGVELGDNVLLNTGVVLAHHARVGAHCYFGPAARVSGFTEIGPRCFVGIGCTVIEKLRIGAGSVIAAGAVVVEDVEADSLVAGVPAVRKKSLR